MPQREPLSAPLLGALVILGALAAGWLDLAVEALAQGAAGALGGLPGLALVLEPPYGLPIVHAAAEGARSVWTLAAFLLAGPLAAMATGAIAHALAEGVGAPALVRVVAFEMFAFSWMRLPLLLVVAGLAAGTGPLAGVYGRLGEPESGRWTAVALGLLVLWGATGLVARRAVALGKAWLRVDGAAFRRRLVRLMAAYPFAVATAAYSLERPVAAPGLVAVLLLAVGVCLAVRTPGPVS